MCCHADVIVLCCIKYKNGDKSYNHESSSWDRIKENFGNHLLFLFYGNPDQNELFHYNSDTKELSIRTSDQYDNIPTKTWLAYYYWFYHIENKKSHLITFGDDCTLMDQDLFNRTKFDNIDYGGQRIHGPEWINNWHQGKVDESSPQFNKLSPRPNMNTIWVHEGCGVIFSREAIESLLKKHDLNHKDIDRIESKINDFTMYVYNTCWYNDVLLSHELDDLQFKITKVPYFGIQGDSDTLKQKLFKKVRKTTQAPVANTPPATA